MYVEVDTGVQRDHAKKLSQLESDISTAAAAISTTIDPMAYGLVNMPLAGLSAGLISVFKKVVEGQSEDAGTTAKGVLAMAKTHDTSDQDADTHIGKAGQA